MTRGWNGAAHLQVALLRALVECLEGARLFELSAAERPVAGPPWDSPLTQAQQRRGGAVFYWVTDLNWALLMSCSPPLALATPFVPP